ncbi:MAG: TetR/AcrR family transcriptional regulator [Panacagrimonas sp.]
MNPPATPATRRRASAPVAEPRKKSRLRRAAVSEDFIIEIATRLFSERGYPAISIRDIAAACEVNIPSIYHYFTDKDDLYDRCCEHAWTQASTPLHEALAGTEKSAERIKRFALALCEVLRDEQFRRLLERELLLPRSKRFENLTNHHFIAEYKLLIPAVAEVSGLSGAAARARAMSIYALTFGLIVLRPISDIGGAKSAALESPVKLADLVLGSLLPGQDWKKI